MRKLLPRTFSILLLVGLWATAGAAQTGTAQPVAGAEAGRAAVSRAQPGSASTPTRRCGIRVRSLQSRGSRQFSATKILDLDFHVRLRPTPAGERLVRIEIETPNGHLFQTLTVPFTSESRRAGTRRAVEGFPRPVEVQLTRPVRGASHATTVVVGRLPVAGTPIVHSSLYGTWVARAYLDDEIEPCGRARAFFISP